MRVLFIQNNGIQESIGIANLSGILKANGHRTDLLLVSHTPDLLRAIRKFDPGLIAFSALTGVHRSLEARWPRASSVNSPFLLSSAVRIPPARRT